jgi:LacI family transcriptional regulator
MQIVKEYDYSPSRTAQQLVNRAADTIGLIIPMMEYNSPYEFLLGIIAGVYTFAENAGLRVSLFTSKTIERNHQSYVQFCNANNLIGTVIHGLDNTDPQILRLAASEIPCVFIDNAASGTKTCAVSVNNGLACEEVAALLAGLGHRDILYISGSPLAVVTEDRRAGYLRGAARYGITPRVVEAWFSEDQAYEAAKAYILAHPAVTAIFAASDLMAVGAMNACLDLKYRVPDDISIVGFDDLSVSRHTRPLLTTVRQDFYKMGGKAAEMLMEIYNGTEVSGQYFVPYELKVRQSVAKNSRT